MSAGKGDKRRPSSVPQSVVDKRWDAVRWASKGKKRKAGK